jgi:hypothetical protein
MCDIFIVVILYICEYAMQGGFAEKDAATLGGPPQYIRRRPRHNQPDRAEHPGPGPPVPASC